MHFLSYDFVLVSDENKFRHAIQDFSQTSHFFFSHFIFLFQNFFIVFFFMLVLMFLPWIKILFRDAGNELSIPCIWFVRDYTSRLSLKKWKSCSLLAYSNEFDVILYHTIKRSGAELWLCPSEEAPNWSNGGGSDGCGRSEVLHLAMELVKGWRMGRWWFFWTMVDTWHWRREHCFTINTSTFAVESKSSFQGEALSLPLIEKHFCRTSPPRELCKEEETFCGITKEKRWAKSKWGGSKCN